MPPTGSGDNDNRGDRMIVASFTVAESMAGVALMKLEKGAGRPKKNSAHDAKNKKSATLRSLGLNLNEALRANRRSANAVDRTDD